MAKEKPKGEAWKGIPKSQFDNMVTLIDQLRHDMEFYRKRNIILQGRVDRKNAVIRDLISELDNARNMTEPSNV